MQIMERGDRDLFRSVVLNHIDDKEMWAFHPLCEYLLVSNFGKVKNILT